MSFSARLYKHAGLVFPAVTVFLALALAGQIDPYLAFVATSWVIFGLLGLSLDVVWGRGGLLSLGQTVFYGLGGYFGSVVSINLAPATGNTLIWALPAAAGFGALAAAALGYIIFFARMGPLQSTSRVSDSVETSASKMSATAVRMASASGKGRGSGSSVKGRQP
ncbi:ABC transporter permease subunit [Thalassococcus profundi]|uniref:ABC transporter permease subunit n=1 Tax=Thalassococcus profundi TaxID=2282382 RepID=UPI0026C3E7D2